PGRVTVDDGEVRHVARDDGAGPDERELPDRHPRHNRGVRADRGAAPHSRSDEIGRGVARDVGARREHVGEDHTRAQEDAFFQLPATIDAHVILNPAPVADHDTRADDTVLPDAALPPDPAVAHDVRKVPDPRSLADLARFVDVAARVDLAG